MAGEPEGFAGFLIEALEMVGFLRVLDAGAGFADDSGLCVSPFDLMLLLGLNFLADAEGKEQDDQSHPKENPPFHHEVPPLFHSGDPPLC